jgi:hypothetical protein
MDNFPNFFQPICPLPENLRFVFLFTQVHMLTHVFARIITKHRGAVIPDKLRNGWAFSRTAPKFC